MSSQVRQVSGEEADVLQRFVVFSFLKDFSQNSKFRTFDDDDDITSYLRNVVDISQKCAAYVRKISAKKTHAFFFANGRRVANSVAGSTLAESSGSNLARVADAHHRHRIADLRYGKHPSKSRKQCSVVCTHRRSASQPAARILFFFRRDVMEGELRKDPARILEKNKRN